MVNPDRKEQPKSDPKKAKFDPNAFDFKRLGSRNSLFDPLKWSMPDKKEQPKSDPKKAKFDPNAFDFKKIGLS